MQQYDSDIASYTVATLNYSASIISPYQFHQQETQDLSLFQFQLDNAFKFFAEKQFPNFNQNGFDWGNASSIDLIWKDRFSPFYRQQCGVGSNGKMMSEKEFILQWNKQCQKVKTKIIQQGVQRQMMKGSKLLKQQIAGDIQKQILACRIFDLIGYKAFIKALYGVQNIDQLNVSANIYKQQRSKHFSKIYINTDLKKQRTVSIIQKSEYDIFCMQQCTQDVLNYFKKNLKSYLLVQNSNQKQICESIILLKQSKFPNTTIESIEQQRSNFLINFARLIKNPANFTKKFSQQTINYLKQKSQEHKSDSQAQLARKLNEQLFWNKDTCYAVIGPLVVFSPHISTKNNLNTVQIDQIKKTITKILTYFPEKHFICAGDLNGQFDNQINFETVDKKYIKVNVFPYNNEDITCYKMRTYTQTQRNKAMQINFCRKDFVITDLKISQHSVIIVDGTQIKKNNAPLIPNENHPFDHFIVTASVKAIGRIQSSSPLRRKKPVSSYYEGFSIDHVPDKII